MRSPLLGTLLGLSVALTPLHVGASPFSIRTLREPPAAAEGHEDPRVAEAKAEYQRGSAAYAMGNYAEAVTFFERSYELSHQSALLFNLGQSYLKWYDISSDLQHLRKSKKLFENYRLFLQGSDPVDPESIQATEDLIVEVDEKIAQHEAEHEMPPPPKEDRPVAKKGWFWAAIGGGVLLVAGGVTAAVLLTRNRGGGDSFDPELGTIGHEPAGARPGFHF